MFLNQSQKKVLAIKGNGAYTFVADSTLGSGFAREPPTLPKE